MVRASLKEPAKAAAKQRETVYFRSAQWAEGKPTKQGEDNNPSHEFAQPCTVIRVQSFILADKHMATRISLWLWHVLP